MVFRGKSLLKLRFCKTHYILSATLLHAFTFMIIIYNPHDVLENKVYMLSAIGVRQRFTHRCRTHSRVKDSSFLLGVSLRVFKYVRKRWYFKNTTKF